MERTLPTRRQAIAATRGRTKGIKVVVDTPAEAAVVALRQALINRYPDARCFFYAEDLSLSTVSEGRCAGRVVCQSVADGAARVAPPKTIQFDITWERAKDGFGLPTVRVVKYSIKE